jgi:hypothetical protein
VVTKDVLGIAAFGLLMLLVLVLMMKLLMRGRHLLLPQLMNDYPFTR